CRITSFYDAKQTTKDSLMFHTQTILYHEVAEGVIQPLPFILQRRNLLNGNMGDSSNLHLFMSLTGDYFYVPFLLECPQTNEKCLKKLTNIVLENIDLYGQDSVYVIRFDWKHPNMVKLPKGIVRARKANLFRERLIIRISDFAILQEEHIIHFKETKFQPAFEFGIPALRRMQRSRLIRTYRPYQGTWYPAYISARLEGELKLPTKSEVQPYVYELELSTLSIDPTGDALPAGTYWGALNNVPYRPAFWRQFDSRQR
ncbi:MAG: hypothetical protein D6730_19840, partial [Bacteroidetes bacterium]